MEDYFKAAWKSLLVRGLIAVVLGVMVMIWPDITMKVLVFLVGLWALVDGIALLVDAFRAHSGGEKGLLGLLGVAALIVAFFCLFRPGVAAATVVWFIGVWLIIRALFEFFAAFGSDLPMPRWLAFLSAAIDLALGLIFVIHPHASANGIAWLLGLFIVIGGILSIALAFTARSAAKEIGAGSMDGSPA